MRDDAYFERLLLNVIGLNAMFPRGNDPFRIMTRVCEGAGELAKAGNHGEGSGIKSEQHGPPDLAHLAEEVHHVLRAALAVTMHDGVLEDVKRSIDLSNAQLRSDGYLRV